MRLAAWQGAPEVNGAGEGMRGAIALRPCVHDAAARSLDDPLSLAVTLYFTSGAAQVLCPLATSLLLVRGDVTPSARCANLTQSVSRPRTIVPKPAGVLRVFAIIYAVQAAAGIVAGVAYAVWLLYW